MSSHCVESETSTLDKVTHGRCDLAAALRISARENLHEGIDNHFSFALGDGTFLVNRWGVHWSKITKTDIVRVNHEGHVVEGSGVVEKTAFFIHEAVHRLCPHAVAILHTHMPYATALSCTEGGFTETLSQAALQFYGKVAYERYGGLANDKNEGGRLAANMGDKTVLILENHGVMIAARTMGIAMHDLYFFERAAKFQVLAQGTGSPLKTIPSKIADLTARQMAELDADKETYFDAMKSILDEDEPEYRT